MKLSKGELKVLGSSLAVLSKEPMANAGLAFRIAKANFIVTNLLRMLEQEEVDLALAHCEKNDDGSPRMPMPGALEVSDPSAFLREHAALLAEASEIDIELTLDEKSFESAGIRLKPETLAPLLRFMKE